MQRNHSFWRQIEFPSFSPIPGNTDTGIVVVGGGICGLLCAYLLLKKGAKDVVVVDAGELYGGVTADTTAKITSQHGLIYHNILGGIGEEAAVEYAAANESAIRMYREIISKENIHCDLAECGAWVYTTGQSNVPNLEEEARIARCVGIDASFEVESELPFPVAGAVRFGGQAHFHPTKFTAALSEKLMQAGCRIYTHTRATGAETGIVHTDKGDILARHIICCTHYPFIDKHSMLFSMIYQSRSYVAALKGAASLRDMYVDCAKGGLSFRPQRDENGEELLLLGACDHKTGHEGDILHYRQLLEQMRNLYPEAKTAWLWSAQDCMTHDQIPYICRYPNAGENIYLATGFNKWGMTSSMVAADRISDMVMSGKSDEGSVFSLERKDAGLKAKSFVKESTDTAGNFLVHLTMPRKRLSDLGAGEGGIVEVNGKRIGAYRDESGVVHAIRPICRHMGCAVNWNADENTWDCTCHGSRYDYRGNVISGPAFLPLEIVDI